MWDLVVHKTNTSSADRQGSRRFNRFRTNLCENKRSLRPGFLQQLSEIVSIELRCSFCRNPLPFLGILHCMSYLHLLCWFGFLHQIWLAKGSWLSDDDCLKREQRQIKGRVHQINGRQDPLGFGIVSRDCASSSAVAFDSLDANRTPFSGPSCRRSSWRCQWASGPPVSALLFFDWHCHSSNMI